MNHDITKPLVVITYGPAHVPIDEVRRLSNTSTGAFGETLLSQFSQKGWRIVAFRGEGAICRRCPPEVDLRPFGTNQELAYGLQELSREAQPRAILQAAALCDFELSRIESPRDGHLTGCRKISSSTPDVTLHLKPAPKILPTLRQLFPEATLVGWKYAMEGSRKDALEAARRQMKECQSQLCVINGTAWGDGFGCLTQEETLQVFDAKEEVAEYLENLLAGHPQE